MIMYVEGEGFAISDNAEKIALESCMQEILLWKGENLMNTEMGIDYFGVIEGYTYLRTSIENITDKYKGSFRDIKVSEPVFDNAKETLSISIEFMLIDYSVETKKVSIGM